jgi:hypothetical protein
MFFSRHKLLAAKLVASALNAIKGLRPQNKTLSSSPLEHSVYHGRRRLGRYIRIAAKRYAAYDARNRLLGKFKKSKDAWAAIGRASAGAAQ